MYTPVRNRERSRGGCAHAVLHRWATITTEGYNTQQGQGGGAREASQRRREERVGVGGRGRAQTEARSERSCLNIRPPCHIISTLSAAGGQPGTDVRSPRGGAFRAIEP